MTSEFTNIINNMTHKELMRFARVLGLKGDFMKGDNGLSATEYLRNRVTTAAISLSDIALQVNLNEAFPGGYRSKHWRGKGYYKRNGGGGYQPTPATESPAADVPSPSPAPSIPKAEMGGEFCKESLPSPNPDLAAQLASLLAQLAGNNQPKQELDHNAINALVQKSVKDAVEALGRPTRVEVFSTEEDQPRFSGLVHRDFESILRKVKAGVNVMLVGPAGSGKTTLAEQVAKALNLPFYFNGALDSAYKLTGFIDAQGRIISTAFRKAFEFGGLYLFDEVDGSLPGALLAFNAALANGKYDFPDGTVDAHPNFRCMAAANTYGLGADRIYVGRNQLDAASLDRFVMKDFGYDENLEISLYGNNEWVLFVQKARHAAASLKIRHVISPRASMNGVKLLAAGDTWEEVEQCVLWKGLQAADIAKIKGSM